MERRPAATVYLLSYTNDTGICFGQAQDDAIAHTDWTGLMDGVCQIQRAPMGGVYQVSFSVFSILAAGYLCDRHAAL